MADGVRARAARCRNCTSTLYLSINIPSQASQPWQAGAPGTPSASPVLGLPDALIAGALLPKLSQAEDRAALAGTCSSLHGACTVAADTLRLSSAEGARAWLRSGAQRPHARIHELNLLVSAPGRWGLAHGCRAACAHAAACHHSSTHPLAFALPIPRSAAWACELLLGGSQRLAHVRVLRLDTRPGRRSAQANSPALQIPKASSDAEAGKGGVYQYMGLSFESSASVMVSTCSPCRRPMAATQQGL